MDRRKATYEIFIYEGIKKREAVEVKCDECGKKFLKSKRFVKEGKNNYCNKKCRSESLTNQVELICDNCGKEYSVPVSRVKNSKSGYHFCSKVCKDEGQKIKNGLKGMWPEHFGNGNGRNTYRRLAFDNYKHECEVCGYDEHEGLLHVHHIDCNRNNNDIDNLMILCPTCHWALTLKLAEIKDDRLYEWIVK